MKLRDSFEILRYKYLKNGISFFTHVKTNTRYQWLLFSKNILNRRKKVNHEGIQINIARTAGGGGSPTVKQS